MVALTILDETKDADALAAIRTADHFSAEPITVLKSDDVYAGTLTERVDRVVQQIIAPVLANDGGRLDILDLNESTGELSVRFVGSCSNCPYSLLSMEQIVKPTLLAIPGIQRVTHRARARDHEVEAARLRIPIEQVSVAKWIPIKSSCKVAV